MCIQFNFLDEKSWNDGFLSACSGPRFLALAVVQPLASLLAFTIAVASAEEHVGHSAHSSWFAAPDDPALWRFRWSAVRCLGFFALVDRIEWSRLRLARQAGSALQHPPLPKMSEKAALHICATLRAELTILPRRQCAG